MCSLSQVLTQAANDARAEGYSLGTRCEISGSGLVSYTAEFRNFTRAVEIVVRAWSGRPCCRSKTRDFIHILKSGSASKCKCEWEREKLRLTR